MNQSTLLVRNQIAADLLAPNGFFSNWIPTLQRKVLAELLDGEEGGYYLTKLHQLKEVISNMPSISDGEVSGDSDIHLHYFGVIDAWILQKDSSIEQTQAFGYVSNSGASNAELGYVDIVSLLSSPLIEIDLHWRKRSFNCLDK